ncbi:MAG: twin-arginine translocation signal domain-containing protein, partial [Pseudomonadota bacterium]
MDRRSFIKKAGIAGTVGAAASLATPALAQGVRELTIVSTWPRDFPGLGTSAQRLARRIGEISDGKIE